MADYIILDSAAGFSEEAIATIEAGEEIIVVTNPELPAVTDALKAVKIARNAGKSVRGVIVTRHKAARYEMPLSSIKSMLETSIIGVIPEDDSVKHSLTKRDAVVHTHPRSRVARKYVEIANKINGSQAKKEGVLTRLFGGLRHLED